MEWKIVKKTDGKREELVWVWKKKEIEKKMKDEMFALKITIFCFPFV